MTTFTYREKEYDIAALQRIASQGVRISAPLNKLVWIKDVNPIECDRLVVVASGETYEVIGGSVALDAKGQPKPEQVAYLLSKPVLKKAVVQTPEEVEVDRFENSMRSQLQDFNAQRHRPNERYAPRPEQRNEPRRDFRPAPQSAGGFDNRRPQGDRTQYPTQQRPFRPR